MAKRPRIIELSSAALSSTEVASKDALPQMPIWFSRDWLLGSILFLAVLLVYQPVWHAGFIWDDDILITENPSLIGWAGLKSIWTSSAADICPLTLTVFWVEHALWGLDPLPYHVVNVLLHGACVLVLWQLLRRLEVPGAWLGAALWALHPVGVETVAWVTETKNTLSGLFFLLAIFFFINRLRVGDSSGRQANLRNDVLMLLCAALAMASKSSTVILPVVLCLVAWWLEGKCNWRTVVRVVPVFLVLLAAIAQTLAITRLQLASDSPVVRSWPDRLVTASHAVWFYLGKLLWPHPLITVYPRWEIDSKQWLFYLPLLAAIVALAILWCLRTAWGRSCFFAFAYFLVALLPILGLVDFYYQRYSFVADHFQYLGSIGPLALAGAGLVTFADFVLPERGRLKATLCAGLLLTLGIVSWQRAWVFVSQETLWTDTLAKNPDCWVAHKGLGYVYSHNGRAEKAVEQYTMILAYDPNKAEANNNLGFALAQNRKLDEAIIHYKKALDADANYVDARNNLGNVLLEKGKIDEAVAQFQMVLDSHPAVAEYHNNLANAFLQGGRLDEAVVQYQQALEIEPALTQTRTNLGNALLQKGQLLEAMTQFEKALELDPTACEPHNSLGVVLFQMGRADEAVAQFQEALRLKPDYADAQNNLSKVEAAVQQGAGQTK